MDEKKDILDETKERINAYQRIHANVEETLKCLHKTVEVMEAALENNSSIESLFSMVDEMKKLEEEFYYLIDFITDK